MKTVWLVVAAVGMAGPSLVWPHGDAPLEGKARKPVVATDERAFGREGDPQKVSRTVRIDMADTMRYSPSQISVRQGETIRFEIRNSGKVMHELVLGTKKELEAHATLMKKHPGMEHDEPHMAHVAPGKTGHVVWQFSRRGEFFYGCLLPGHFEAGMIGTVIVK
jgi:uncharacterized cupredoxin-like copper-binding protein